VTTSCPFTWRVGHRGLHAWSLFRAPSVSIEVVRHLKPLTELIIDLVWAGQIDHVQNAVRAGREHAGDSRIVNPLRQVQQKLHRPYTRADLGDLTVALEETPTLTASS
jgi:hypothetical protein